MYGVPPHMVGDTEKSTSWGSGIEQQKDGFVTFTMQPWMELIETWLEIALFPKGQRLHFVEFDFKGLMRGDTTARSNWYEKMIKNGVITPNDVLRKENEKPYEGGDVYQRPLNTAFVNAKGEVVSVTPPGGADLNASKTN
jgi:HK97 family phage portal protein